MPWSNPGLGAIQAADANRANEPFIGFLNQNLINAGLDPLHPVMGQGCVYGYPYVEALRIAAELPGGLTRTNFILAVRALDITHPMLIDGIGFRTNGNRDAFFIEGAQVLSYISETDWWRTAGRAIDINGQTPNCAWSESRGRCR